MKRRIKNNKSAQVQIAAAIAVIIIIREKERERERAAAMRLARSALCSLSKVMLMGGTVVGEISQWSLPPGIIHFG